MSTEKIIAVIIMHQTKINSKLKDFGDKDMRILPQEGQVYFFL
jgi:hypothetical protein